MPVALARGRRLAACCSALLLAGPISTPARAVPFSGYEYVCPVPGSRLVSTSNNIILRPGGKLGAHQLRKFSILVTGQTSGVHAGKLSLSDDSRTLIFEPDTPFATGEEVLVQAGRTSGRDHGFQNANDLERPGRGHRGTDALPSIEFNFFVSPRRSAEFLALAMHQSLSDEPGLAEAMLQVPIGLQPHDTWPDPPPGDDPPPPPSEPPPPPGNGPPVPPGFPELHVIGAPNDPSPGVVFMALFSSTADLPGNITIVDDDATPVFYRRLWSQAIDFKRQPNGLLTYFTVSGSADHTPRFFALDSSYTVVDSFTAGNGYTTDSHDLQLLRNGHALLLSYDPQPVRMDSIVPGGSPNAIVTGLVVQELDRARRVVFQWRSWDHFAITDVHSADQRLSGGTIDWVHGNAVQRDTDGNLLISSRHLDEITKIDRRTGDVIWRMGKNAVNNQFTFDASDRGYSHQHDIRRLPNGHLTLFDNGNYMIPERSRAVEYEVDESGKTAHLVWEYRHTPDNYGPFMGNVQQLPDGGRMIGWGGQAMGAKLTELHADGTVAFELGFGGPTIWTYRAYRSPWRTTRIRAPQSIAFGGVMVGATTIRPVIVTNPGPGPITLTSYEMKGDSGFTVLDVPPVLLSVGASDTLQVAFHSRSPGLAEAKLTLASVTDDQRIAQQVSLSATVVSQLVAKQVAPESQERQPGETALAFSARVQNPGRGATTFHYSLPKTTPISLEVFAVGGRRIETLKSGVESAGDHVLVWDPADIPSGIYFCRLVAGPDVLTRKFALIR